MIYYSIGQHDTEIQDLYVYVKVVEEINIFVGCNTIENLHVIYIRK